MKRKCFELVDKSAVDGTTVNNGSILGNTSSYQHRERKRRRREARKETYNIFTDSLNLSEFQTSHVDEFYPSHAKKGSKQISPCRVHDANEGTNSLHVDSDSSVRNCSIQDSLDSLRSNLIELGMTPSDRFENSMRLRFKKVAEKDRIKMRISLNLKAEEESELQRKEDVLCRVSEVLKTPHKNSVEVRQCTTRTDAKTLKGKSGTSIFHWFKSTRRKRQNDPRRKFTKSRASDIEVDDAIRSTLFCMF